MFILVFLRFIIVHVYYSYHFLFLFGQIFQFHAYTLLMALLSDHDDTE